MKNLISTVVRSCLMLALISGWFFDAAAAETVVFVEGGYGNAESAKISDRNGFDSVDCLICVSGDLNHIENGALLGAGFGYRVKSSLRIEVSYTYRGWNDLAAQDSRDTMYHSSIKSHAAMLSGFFDPPLALGKAKPYVGAGFGLARNKMGSIHQDFADGVQDDPGGSVSGIAWQIMLGLNLPVSPQYALNLGYRHFDGGKLRTDAGTSVVEFRPDAPFEYQSGGVEGKLRTDELILSLRYAF